MHNVEKNTCTLEMNMEKSLVTLDERMNKSITGHERYAWEDPAYPREIPSKLVY